MTELHPNNGNPLMKDRLLKPRTVIDAAKRGSIEGANDSTQRLSRSIRRNWEMIVIWSFVVLSFAVFLLCGFILWAKCQRGGAF